VLTDAGAGTRVAEKYCASNHWQPRQSTSEIRRGRVSLIVTPLLAAGVVGPAPMVIRCETNSSIQLLPKGSNPSMARGTYTFRQRDMKAALKAVEAAVGREVKWVDIFPDGRFRVSVTTEPVKGLAEPPEGEDATGQNDFDE
jgi:hypothetical protein